MTGGARRWSSRGCSPGRRRPPRRVYAGYDADLSYINETEQRLLCVEQQLHQLYMSLGTAAVGAVLDPLDDREHAEPVIRGDIELLPNGGYRRREEPS
jgi:hypothetical protein